MMRREETMPNSG